MYWFACFASVSLVTGQMIFGAVSHAKALVHRASRFASADFSLSLQEWQIDIFKACF